MLSSAKKYIQKIYFLSTTYLKNVFIPSRLKNTMYSGISHKTQNFQKNSQQELQRDHITLILIDFNILRLTYKAINGWALV